MQMSVDGGRPEAPVLHRRPIGWWVAPVYLVMSLILLPWIGILLATLPDRAVSHNYRLAWVGFDVLLVASMVRTAWLAWRRSPFVVNVASVTAALLVVDAWFDVVTASHREMMRAFLLALLVELPAAVLSLVIAGRAQLQIAKTGAVRPTTASWHLWRRMVAQEIPPIEGAPPGPVVQPGPSAARQPVAEPQPAAAPHSVAERHTVAAAGSGEYVPGGQPGPGQRAEHQDVTGLQDGVGTERVPADRRPEQVAEG
jgi:hypothetical protein